MIKQLVFCFCAILLIVSCSDLSKPEKPEHLIPKDKMVNILIDARLVGAINGTNKRQLENEGFDLKNYVFEKHGIDSLQFAQSNSYYSYHIKEYEAIYNAAIDSLDKLKAILDKKKVQEEKIAKQKEEDSIRKIEKIKDSLLKAEQAKLKTAAKAASGN